MPVPVEVEWNKLSLAGKETVLHITMRLAAGFSLDEVAAALERDQPELRHLPLPPDRRRYTRGWVAARTRQLRAEIEQTGAATY